MRCAAVSGGSSVACTHAVPMIRAVGPPRRASPTNGDFAAALRPALRAFSPPALLTRTPLLQARALAGTDPAGPAELRALLSETVSTLFVSARDEKIRRALELTYFQTAPKQEVVADRLGLAFGTYRRTLATDHKRRADWLCAKR